MPTPPPLGAPGVLSPIGSLCRLVLSFASYVYRVLVCGENDFLHAASTQYPTYKYNAFTFTFMFTPMFTFTSTCIFLPPLIPVAVTCDCDALCERCACACEYRCPYSLLPINKPYSLLSCVCVCVFVVYGHMCTYFCVNQCVHASSVLSSSADCARFGTARSGEGG